MTVVITDILRSKVSDKKKRWAIKFIIENRAFCPDWYSVFNYIAAYHGRKEHLKMISVYYNKETMHRRWRTTISGYRLRAHIGQ